MSNSKKRNFLLLMMMMMLLLLFLTIRLDDRLISYFIYQSLRKETKGIYFDF
jgi:hypothetical protein